MQTTQPQRAAILIHTGNVDDVRIKAQQEACRRYCQRNGYQISEQDVYRNEGRLLYSETPQLVQLRMHTVQGHFDVLVIPWTECLGPLPLWVSPPVATTIDGFYKYQVRIESVIARHSVHDIHQQMLLDAIHFVEQVKAARAEHRPLYKRDNRDREQ